MSRSAYYHILNAILFYLILYSCHGFYRHSKLQQFEHGDTTDILSDTCYMKIVQDSDSLELLFSIKGDSIFALSRFKVIATHQQFKQMAAPSCVYHVASLKNQDTVLIKRCADDIFIRDLAVLDYKTFVYPTKNLGNGRHLIIHKSILRGDSSSEENVYERRFYFSEGAVCPDSIVFDKLGLGLFVYD